MTSYAGSMRMTNRADWLRMTSCVGSTQTTSCVGLLRMTSSADSTRTRRFEGRTKTRSSGDWNRVMSGRRRQRVGRLCARAGAGNPLVHPAVRTAQDLETTLVGPEP